MALSIKQIRRILMASKARAKAKKAGKFYLVSKGGKKSYPKGKYGGKKGGGGGGGGGGG